MGCLEGHQLKCKQKPTALLKKRSIYATDTPENVQGLCLNANKKLLQPFDTSVVLWQIIVRLGGLPERKQTAAASNYQTVYSSGIFQVPRVRRNPKIMGWCVEESLPKPPVNRKEQEVVLTVLWFSSEALETGRRIVRRNAANTTIFGWVRRWKVFLLALYSCHQRSRKWSPCQRKAHCCHPQLWTLTQIMSLHPHH